jgi:hypothetical protein
LSLHIAPRPFWAIFSPAFQSPIRPPLGILIALSCDSSMRLATSTGGLSACRLQTPLVFVELDAIHRRLAAGAEVALEHRGDLFDVGAGRFVPLAERGGGGARGERHGERKEQESSHRRLLSA